MVMSRIQSGRVTAIILLASFLMSCGGKAGGEKETSGADSRAQESTETAAVAEEYVYPDKSYGG